MILTKETREKLLELLGDPFIVIHAGEKKELSIITHGLTSKDLCNYLEEAVRVLKVKEEV